MPCKDLIFSRFKAAELILRNFTKREMPMSAIIQAPNINALRRTHKRITMRFSLEVTGKDENGHSFRAVAKMRNVSAWGGCMAIVKNLAKGDLVHMRA
jgi:hypothetical protein